MVSTNTELRLAFLLLDDGKNPESPLTSDTTQVRRGRSASLLQMEVQTSHGVSSDTVGTRWSLLTIKNESPGFLNGLLWHPGVGILGCTFPGFLCRESKLFSRSLFMPIGISGLPAPPSLSLTYMREKNLGHSLHVVP